MHPAIRRDGVAVITGAAKGIGFAIAQSVARMGMRLVLLDSDEDALHDASNRLRQNQVRVSAVVGDVTDQGLIARLQDEAMSLGDVALVVNNAGIIKGAGPWQDPEKWRRLMEINFWSVLTMQQAFMPQLLSQTTPSAIVNLGSKEGITTPPGNAAYSVSKAALRVLTEQLAHELRERVGSKVTAHLLIPGYTFTPMNYPGMTQETSKPEAMWTADQVADSLLARMAINDFYILCEDNEVTRALDEKRIQWSADDLIQNRPALSRWHPDFREQFKEFAHEAVTTIPSKSQ
ncbi:SDR family NAD(P)-dependent oxidoreductase [Paraburkholderia phenoliruptrix]|uniref:SDR family NAD(P)-dependent oxidoreductase n=1 Tax=Paraburkholderia phenoliruptrix TaxID=252970 RepID=UPI0028699A5E|nr:SDR family oxidoreductase [Paraburkholderia phenoliruptrix]WMY09591.1 SDR family NAD(P)-dependent oxidoreductase [Paraburkholderia phenoliruptrix]